MAVRFSQIYYSNEGTKYRVQIHDADQVGDTSYELFFYDDTGVTISRRAGKGEYSRIISTNMELTITLSDTNAEDLYDDILLSHEGRFFMTLDTYNSVTDALLPIAKGEILLDVGEIERADEPAFTIRATDGLERLKDKKYYASTSSNDFHTMAEHIARILTQLPVVDELYSPLATIFGVAMTMVDTDHGLTPDVPAETRFKNYFYELVDGVKRYDNMYSVLEQILSAWDLYLFMDHGFFMIQQYGYSSLTEEIEYIEYNSSGNANISTFTRYTDINFNTQDPYQADAHPSISYVPPLKEVVVRQVGKYIGNVLFGAYWDTNDTGLEYVTTISEVNGVDKMFWKFKYQHYLFTSRPMPFDIALVAWAEIQMTMKVVDNAGDEWYYKGTYFNNIYDNLNGPIQNLQVDTVQITPVLHDVANVAQVVKMIVPITKLYPGNPSGVVIPGWNVQIEAPIERTGEVYFNIDNMQLYSNLSLDPFVKNVSYAIAPYANEQEFWRAGGHAFLIGPTLEDAYRQSERITTVTNDAQNTDIAEVEFSMGTYAGYQIIDSFPIITNSQYRIQIYDGADWIDSTGWLLSGDTTDNRLAIQTARDMIRLRKNPTKWIDISFWNKSSNHTWYDQRIIIDGDVYIWREYDLPTGLDTVTGGLWQMLDGTVTVAEDPPAETDLPTSEVIGLPPGFSVPNDLPPPVDDDGVFNFTDPPAGTSTDSYYYEGTLGANNYVELSDYNAFPDPDEATILSINHSMKVIVGSTWYHIKDVATDAELAPTDCRLDYANKRIYFRSAMAGRLIRVQADNRYVYNAVVL